MKKSVACIAFQNGKILIAHRNPTGQMGGRWEFPGGKVEEGESSETAIVREMGEEFGIKVKVLKKITEGSFIHNGKTSALEAFLIEPEHDGIAKKFTLTEHTEYKWVNPDEIKNENFVDSDLAIYPAVCEFLKSI